MSKLDKESKENHRKLMGYYLELFEMFTEETHKRKGANASLPNEIYMGLFRGYIDCYNGAIERPIEHKITLGSEGRTDT